jgi:hypothetical protein
MAGAANVSLSRGELRAAVGGAGNRMELWRVCLLIFVGVLCVEQFIGWYFGRRRQFRS